MTINDFKNKLVTKISENPKVKGIGQTGNINARLVAGQSDVDLFILCTEVLTEEERKQVYDTFSKDYEECILEVSKGGIWGHGDVLMFEGSEFMPMYFTITEMEEYLRTTLQGKRIAKERGFYPTGRLASVEKINILYEEDKTWTRLQNLVKIYPKDLFHKLYHYHMAKVLDEEDLGRVLLRKEILFYHQVLEEAIDHLLQALFAVNSVYFPSRKRTQEQIEKLQFKPQNCHDRLEQIIKNAAKTDTIDDSVRELRAMTNEIKRIGTRFYK
jgi:hypothetical protein